MIKLLAFNKHQFSTKEYIVKPTIFPDGTSQIWKLPEEMLGCSEYKLIWNFENERELIDILSLGELLIDYNVNLHIPYLPYARQDKDVSNSSTFNLKVLADCLNQCEFNKVTSVDVHNPNKTSELINNFENIEIKDIHYDLIKKLNPDHLLFPDKGAAERYKFSGRYSLAKDIYCEKVRDQKTGEITHFKLTEILKNVKKVLIIDDICDGGRTFVEVAKAIRNDTPNCHITLFVTHGIFSKGNKLEGIDEIFTTNSLLKNSTAHYEV